jgi:hypothetical protein
VTRWYDSDAEIYSVTTTLQMDGTTAIKVDWQVGKAMRTDEVMVATADLNEETKEKIKNLQASVLVLSELLSDGNVSKEDDEDSGMGWRS